MTGEKPLAATESLHILLWFGLAIEILAGIVQGLADGRTAPHVIALLMAGAGGLMVFIATVGWGVMLGVRAAKEAES